MLMLLARKTALAQIGEPGSKKEALIQDALTQVVQRCIEIASEVAKAEFPKNAGYCAGAAIKAHIEREFPEVLERQPERRKEGV